jgi:hypothetical protein
MALGERLPPDYDGPKIEAILETLERKVKGVERLSQKELKDLSIEIKDSITDVEQRLTDKIEGSGKEDDVFPTTLPIPQNLKVFEAISLGFAHVDAFQRARYFGKLVNYEFYGSPNSFEISAYIHKGTGDGTGRICTLDGNGNPVCPNHGVLDFAVEGSKIVKTPEHNPQENPYPQHGTHRGTGTVASRDTYLNTKHPEDDDLSWVLDTRLFNPLWVGVLKEKRIIIQNITRSTKGICDETVADKIKDADGDFLNKNIDTSYMYAHNLKDNKDANWTRVTNIDDTGTLTVADDIFEAGDHYTVGYGRIEGYRLLNPLGLFAGIKYEIQAQGVKWVEGDEWRIAEYPANKLFSIGAFCTFTKRAGSFFVKARSVGKGNSYSQFTEEEESVGITSEGSSDEPLEWNAADKIDAKPVYWNRTIVVTWSLLISPLRVDYYRLFRKADTPPSSDQLADNSIGNPYWVKDTGRWNIHTDYSRTENPDIVEETIYYYWVWCFDKNGDPSAHYLGASGPNTTPDNAELGEPDEPEIHPDATLDRVEYQTTAIFPGIKWFCNVGLVFRGIAEGFWAQYRMKGLLLWSIPIWVDYDSSWLNYHIAEFQNLIAGRTYQFRVRAVNVPVSLVSDWATQPAGYEEIAIPYDPNPPDEIEGVSAQRFFRSGFRKGEFIRVNWNQPILAVLGQQITHYEVYRTVGSEADADTYAASINADTATPYDGMIKFEGTRFVDDDVEPLPEGPQEMTWDGEGATEALRRTADFEGLALEGTLNGGAAINTNNPNGGSYSLEISAAGDYLQIPNGGDGWFDPNEGYITVYIDIGSLPPGTQSYFRIYKDSDNFLELYHFSGRLYFKYRANGTTVETNRIAATWVGFAKVEMRWKVSTDTFELRFNEGSWSSGSGMDTFAGAPTAVLQLGSPVDYLDPYHIDDWTITDSYAVAAQQYYHYWVRAVDIDNKKSIVSRPGDSHDQVSFDPPDAPINLDIVQNVVGILIFKMQTMKFTWDPVDEAVWYRVKMRMKAPGRANWGPWLYSARLREEVVSDIDDDNPGGIPKYVFPFPVLKDTEVEWAVSAENMAGKNWSVIASETISADDEGPGIIQNFTGECHGWRFFGLKFWIGYTLKWDDRPWYEGIASYEIQWYNESSTWVTRGFRFPTIIPGKKVVFNDFALPVAGLHKFRVITTDGDDNTSTSPILEVPWSGFWTTAR